MLAELGPDGLDSTHRHFADRFGQLMGLQGSMLLSKMHEELSAMRGQPDPDATAGVAQNAREESLRVCGELMRTLAMCFDPAKGKGWGGLPVPEALHAHFQSTGVYEARQSGSPRRLAAAFAPYRKFYTARQRDLDVRLQQLRAHIGAAITRLSPELAQVARLDATLTQVLCARSRELFSVIPQLLAQRFGQDLDRYRRQLPKAPAAADLAPWMQPGGWIHAFCIRMRKLLFAELEVRLQPVLGMIDSLPETTDAGFISAGGNAPDRG